jgi:hypothetical protein
MVTAGTLRAEAAAVCPYSVLADSEINSGIIDELEFRVGKLGNGDGAVAA